MQHKLHVKCRQFFNSNKRSHSSATALMCSSSHFKRNLVMKIFPFSMSILHEKLLVTFIITGPVGFSFRYHYFYFFLHSFQLQLFFHICFVFTHIPSLPSTLQLNFLCQNYNDLVFPLNFPLDTITSIHSLTSLKFSVLKCPLLPLSYQL